MIKDKLQYLEILKDKLEQSNTKEFKNFKELCELMEWNATAGGTYKQARLKELETVCDFIKQGHKIIINKIKDSINEEDINFGKGISEGSRGNNKVTYTEDYKVPSDKHNNIGVYIITDKDNNCYIGSTISGFRNRYRQHKKGENENMEHTYNLINNYGAEFRVLHDMTGIEDIELIRMVEDEYIQYFKSLPQYNVINRNKYAYAKNGYHQEQKTKYKSIKVREEDYTLAIKWLKDKNINIKETD